MALIGVDVGTTGTKSTVFDDDGSIRGYAYREYYLKTGQPGIFELNTVALRDAVKEVLAESVRKYNGSDINAICVTSFGESIVILDDNNEALCNSMIYMDTRGDEQCRIMKDHFTKERIAKKTGLLPHSMYTACKMKWISENKPGIFKKAKKCFFIADYVLYLLGGGHYTDYSLASRSMAFDVIRKKWWSEMLDYIGIAESILPEPVPTGSVVGSINPKVASDLGLPQGVKLVIGGHDQIANALGAGVLEAGMAMNGIGTVDCITPAFSMDEINTSLANYNFPCVPYINDRMYVTYAFNMTGGSILKWFRDNFAADLSCSAKEKGMNVYSLLDEIAPDKPTNILVLPHFAGAGTPYMDVSSRGAIVGLTFDVDRNHIYRALLEGEVYEMKYNLECLEISGVKIDELRTVGGGSRSDLWMQIRADIIGKNVVCLNIEEAGTLGSAMLAGFATGIYKSLEEARSALVKVKKVYCPNPSNGAIYKENYEKYKKLYKNIKDVIA